MTMSIVDLPDPDGPVTATLSPGAIARSMPRRMLTSPAALANLRCTSRSSTIGAPCAADVVTREAEDVSFMKWWLRAYGVAVRLVNARLLEAAVVVALLVAIARPAPPESPRPRFLALVHNLTP